MPFLFILAVTLLIHTSFKGSKVLLTLYAIELGANPFAYRLPLFELWIKIGP